MLHLGWVVDVIVGGVVVWRLRKLVMMFWCLMRCGVRRSTRTWARASSKFRWRGSHASNVEDRLQHQQHRIALPIVTTLVRIRATGENMLVTPNRRGQACAAMPLSPCLPCPSIPHMRILLARLQEGQTSVVFTATCAKGATNINVLPPGVLHTRMLCW